MSFELITPVFINNDVNRKLESSFLFCGVVKRLAELSNVQPVLRERRPHRRSWSSFPCCDMQSHYFFYFLCHGVISELRIISRIYEFVNSYGIRYSLMSITSLSAMNPALPVCLFQTYLPKPLLF